MRGVQAVYLGRNKATDLSPLYEVDGIDCLILEENLLDDLDIKRLVFGDPTNAACPPIVRHTPHYPPATARAPRRPRSYGVHSFFARSYDESCLPEHLEESWILLYNRDGIISKDINYYGVEKGSQKYEAVATSNLIPTLNANFKVNNVYQADLVAEAEEFLMQELGLSADEVTALKQKLGSGN
jgi:hypothetical protein